MTAEQVKSSVLQECERLTQNGDFELAKNLWVEIEPEGFSIVRRNGSNQGFGLCRIYRDETNETQVEIAYRLLGLPKQDSKWELLKAEIKAKNEAEIEAIKNGPQYGLPSEMKEVAYAVGHTMGWVIGTMKRLEEQEDKS